MKYHPPIWPRGAEPANRTLVHQGKRGDLNPPATAHRIRLSNKTRIMEKRLASKVMRGLFALALRCGTKAIF